MCGAVRVPYIGGDGGRAERGMRNARELRKYQTTAFREPACHMTAMIVLKLCGAPSLSIPYNHQMNHAARVHG